VRAMKRKNIDGSWVVDLPDFDDAFVSFNVKTEESADLLRDALTRHAVDGYVISGTSTKTEIGPRGRLK